MVKNEDEQISEKSENSLKNWYFAVIILLIIQMFVYFILTQKLA